MGWAQRAGPPNPHFLASRVENFNSWPANSTMWAGPPGQLFFRFFLIFLITTFLVGLGGPPYFGPPTRP